MLPPVLSSDGKSKSHVVASVVIPWEAVADVGGNCGQAGEGGDWKGRKYPREVSLGCPDGAARPPWEMA